MAHVQVTTATLLFAMVSFAVGCALDAGVEEEGRELIVEVAGQALHGSGETFWLARPGERMTEIPYCFVDLTPQVEMARGSIASSLTNTWTMWANLRFVDLGLCSTSGRADESIRIVNTDVPDPLIPNYQPQAHSRIGTSGIKDPNLRTMPSMWLPFQGQAFTFNCSMGGGLMTLDACMRMVAPHEFGHALGFHHEHLRGGGCISPPPLLPGDVAPNTTLTAFDNNSILERGYCSTAVSPAALTALDRAGVQAIYGYGGGGTTSNPTLCRSPGCAYARYMSPSGPQTSAHALRFQISGRWLKPTEGHQVESQSFIGAWERVRLWRVSGQSDDGYLHYGDVVAIKDRWDYYLSARGGSAVDMRKFPNANEPQDWEKWIIEYPGATPNGRVFINMPIRLKSVAHGGRYLSELFESVYTDTNPATADLRINGSIPL